MQTFEQYVASRPDGEMITFRIHSTGQTIVAHKKNILVVPALQKYRGYECRIEHDEIVLYDREAHRNKYRWTKENGGK